MGATIKKTICLDYEIFYDGIDYNASVEYKLTLWPAYVSFFGSDDIDFDIDSTRIVWLQVDGVEIELFDEERIMSAIEEHHDTIKDIYDRLQEESKDGMVDYVLSFDGDIK